MLMDGEIENFRKLLTAESREEMSITFMEKCMIQCELEQRMIRKRKRLVGKKGGDAVKRLQMNNSPGMDEVRGKIISCGSKVGD